MLNECLCRFFVKWSHLKVHFYVKRNVVRFNVYILRGFLVQYLTLLTLIYSTIYNVYLWSMHLDLTVVLK